MSKEKMGVNEKHKVIAGLLGNPDLAEKELKRDFANRFFETEDIIVVFDCETYDYGYAKPYGERFGKSYADIPSEFPENERFVVLSLKDMPSTNSMTREAVWEKWCNMIYYAMEEWNYPAGKNVTFYLLNTFWSVDLNRVRKAFEQKKYDNTSVRFFWYNDLNHSMTAEEMVQMTDASDVVAVYDSRQIFEKAVVNAFKEKYSDKWEDCNDTGNNFFFLKYDTELPYYTSIGFHSWVMYDSVLLVDYKIENEVRCLYNGIEQHGQGRGASYSKR